MKRTLIKLLILFVATGLLPWIGFVIGQVNSTWALAAHIVGVVAVLAMKVWDWFSKRGKSKTLDDRQDTAVNESHSDVPPAA